MTIIYSECGTTSNENQNTDVLSLVARNGPCNHNHDGALCDVCREMAELESEIEDLHSRLKELHSKHRALRTKRNDFNIVTKLPYDVASDILLRCLPRMERNFDPDDSLPCSGFSTPSLPLTLSAVCLTWRTLVYSIPQLWSTLSIDIDRCNLQHISHRLQCSGSTPLFLSLRVSVFARNANFQSARILDVISLVKHNLHRVALLCLDFPCQVMNTFFSHISNTLPILGELHIHLSTCLDGRRRVCEQPHDFKFINSIDPPSPHKVFVTASSKTNIQLVWNAVRHLSITIFNGRFSQIAEALLFLSKGKRLQVVDILSDKCDRLGPPTGLMVTQNSIRNLRLFGAPLKLLSHTTMPHLESLTLRDNFWDSRNHIVSFLQRSACPLKTLDWKPIGTAPPEQAFIDVFRCMPKVQQLYLNVIYLDEPESERHVVPFLEHLRVVPHDVESSTVHFHDTFLPLLRKFVYAGPVVRAPPSLFLDIAETRSGTSGNKTFLEELTVHCDGSNTPTATDLQRILQLNAARTKVSFLRYDTTYEIVTTDFSACYDSD